MQSPRLGYSIPPDFRGRPLTLVASEEELQIQGTRIRQGHDEAGQSPAGAAHHDVTEVCPVNLGLFSGPQLDELQLRQWNAESGHYLPVDFLGHTGEPFFFEITLVMCRQVSPF
jgi:hypothetical protein